MLAAFRVKAGKSPASLTGADVIIAYNQGGIPNTVLAAEIPGGNAAGGFHCVYLALGRGYNRQIAADDRRDVDRPAQWHAPYCFGYRDCSG